MSNRRLRARQDEDQTLNRKEFAFVIDEMAIGEGSSDHGQ